MALIYELLKRVKINISQCLILLGKLLLLVPATVSLGVLLSPSTYAVHSSAQKIPLAITISPTNTVSPSQNPQSQQSSESAIANDTIVVAGVFAAVVGVILGVLTLAAGIATGVGIFEVRRISRFRKQFEDELKQLHKQAEKPQ